MRRERSTASGRNQKGPPRRRGENNSNSKILTGLQNYWTVVSLDFRKLRLSTDSPNKMTIIPRPHSGENRNPENHPGTGFRQHDELSSDTLLCGAVLTSTEETRTHSRISVKFREFSL